LLTISSETCTETADQVNICWSTLDDPLASLNATAVNETAKSLEAARPSASTYTISLSDLQALTPTTAGSSSTPTSSLATSSASATKIAGAAASSIPTNKPDPGLSGGAIGGIVGGVVGVLAILGFAGFFFWRRRSNAKSNPYAPAESHGAPVYDAFAFPPSELASPVGEIDSSRTYYHEAPITEKYGQHAVSPVAEVPANRAPVELPAEQHYEK
jgi:hypothetical protein